MSTEFRISDAERETAASSLGEHYAAGRLTKEEYDERSALAWSAKFASDLAPLFADLPPARRTGAPTVPGSSTQPSREGHPGWHRLPLVPIFIAVIALVALTHIPWFLFILLGFCWWSGIFRHGRARRHEGRRDWRLR
jgi:hypothetical protein